MRKHLKDYFIPHQGNDYQPHSLQKTAMTGMVLLVLLSFTLANVQSFLWTASDWMISTVLPAVIVDLTNDERSELTLGQLQRSTSLDAAATLKAQHMAEREYFAHFSPTGVSPWFWFAEVDYNFVHAGENLAIHFTDSDGVVKAWMESPAHRANIVNGNYSEIGVGTAEGEFEGFKTVYVVQLFGTPAATPSVAGSGVSVAQAAEIEPVIVAVESAEAPITEPLIVEPIAIPDEVVVLSESVEITEDVVIVEAEPVPVTQEVVEPVEEKPVLTSSFISTSTGAIPASTDPTQLQNTGDTPYFWQMLTQPHVVLQVLYVAIGLLVLVSLLFSIFIEIRKQHPVQIAYSLALLMLMFGLFKVHELLSVGAVIV